MDSVFKQDLRQYLWVVMATLTLATSWDEQCNQKHVLGRGQTVHIDVIQLTSQSRDCVIEFTTKARWRVVLTFTYKPSVSNSSIPENCAYAPDYLLIGNDFTAIGQEVMTSYKFCRQTLGEEIVSRDSRLWLDLRNSPLHRQHSPHPSSLLTVKVTALPQVTCSPREAECSPVQCVPRAALCDGHRDCDNGRDEYCYHFPGHTASKTEAELTRAEMEELERDPAQTGGDHHHRHHHRHQTSQLLVVHKAKPQLPTPPEGITCFMCRDGTCILPRLPRYDYRWGVWLWYLCDGVPHCPDGWDEQAYMCYLSRHFPQLAQSHLFQCQAFEAPASHSHQVRMWSLARCDERRDCRLPEEEGDDLCHNIRLGVTPSDAGSKLYMNPLALTLVILFAIVIVITAFFILRCLDRGQGQSHPRSIPVSGGEDTRQSGVECGVELQGCLAVKSMLVTDKTAPASSSSDSSSCLPHHDFERLRETAV